MAKNAIRETVQLRTLLAKFSLSCFLDIQDLVAVHVLDRKSMLKAGKHVCRSSMSQRGLTVSAGVVSWKENMKGERKEIKDNCCGSAGEIWRKVRVAYYRSDQSASRKEMEEAGRESSKNCVIDCVKEN